jgi:bifunctional enzyme CysN/CysC
VLFRSRFSPGERSARIASIESWHAQPMVTAAAGQSIGITLDEDLFADRGDLISSVRVRPAATRRLRARVFWLHEAPLEVGDRITLRIATAEASGTIAAIDKAVDPGQLAPIQGGAIAQNHVGEIEIALSKPLAADPHAVNPRIGRLVLEQNGRIAGGGLVLAVDAAEKPARSVQTTSANIVAAESGVSAEARAQRFGHHGAVIWLTGLPASGKTTLARALEQRLFDRGGAPILLDGDTLRTGLNSDLGFTPSDRTENIRRVAEVAAHLARNGMIAIVATVSPSAEDRMRARTIAGERFYEIHVAAPVEVCESRDPKGHYRRAHAGEIADFTGVGARYEPPDHPDLTIDSARRSVEAAVQELELLMGGSSILLRPAHSPDFTI